MKMLSMIVNAWSINSNIKMDDVFWEFISMVKKGTGICNTDQIDGIEDFIIGGFRCILQDDELIGVEKLS